MATDTNEHNCNEVFNGPVSFNGPVRHKAGTIAATGLAGDILASQISQHDDTINYAIDGTVASGLDIPVHTFFAAGYVLGVKVRLLDNCNTTDTLTFDVQRLNAGSWTTVMTGTISFSSSDADKAIKTGTLTTLTGVACDAEDSLKIVTGGTNSTGANAIISIRVREAPS